ncbi:phage tail protein [Moraxella sp. ZJ142]|uniref:phage tail assembly protein T n=1 Tax=Moraxella marmotae TaxID=3344520 RepID=UPI0035D3E884
MFKLAGHLGKTVGELESSLSIAEFAEWQAFDQLDPIGGFRGDLQAAIVAASMGGGKLSDYLVIDPNPMTDEMREEYEYRQRLQQLTDEQNALIQVFSNVE